MPTAEDGSPRVGAPFPSEAAMVMPSLLQDILDIGFDVDESIMAFLYTRTSIHLYPRMFQSIQKAPNHPKNLQKTSKNSKKRQKTFKNVKNVQKREKRQKRPKIFSRTSRRPSFYRAAAATAAAATAAAGDRRRSC